MPHDVEFDIPFPRTPPADPTDTEADLAAWLLDLGLLRTPAEAEYFAGMRVGEYSALLFPRGTGADLALVAQVIGIMTVVNDQVDHVTGQRTGRGLAMCDDLVTLMRQEHPRSPRTPAGVAWCRIWPRLAWGMSPGWRDRTRRDSARFYDAYRQPDFRRTVAQYVERREITSALAVQLGLAERSGHFEVPESAREADLVTALYRDTVKIMMFPNDVFSLEREEARHEVDNLVLVMEHGTGRPRGEVIAEIQDLVREAGEHFVRLEARVPDLAAALRLDTSEFDALNRYVRAMRDIAIGLHAYHTGHTTRFDPRAAAHARTSGYEEVRHV
ncbi:hypothetical protein [Actinosynnema sp. NPDC023587]|uniref:terpene synthase family protein n=1 Tax=Actinosynnema sp. NPDC023587 TaxID=3154695 RepID=UPI0033FA2363